MAEVFMCESRVSILSLGSTAVNRLSKSSTMPKTFWLVLDKQENKHAMELQINQTFLSMTQFTVWISLLPYFLHTMTMKNVLIMKMQVANNSN